MNHITLESKTCANKIRVMTQRVVRLYEEKCFSCEEYIGQNEFCKDYIPISDCEIPIGRGSIALLGAER